MSPDMSPYVWDHFEANLSKIADFHPKYEHEG